MTSYVAMSLHRLPILWNMDKKTKDLRTYLSTLSRSGKGARHMIAIISGRYVFRILL